MVCADDRWRVRTARVVPAGDRCDLLLQQRRRRCLADWTHCRGMLEQWKLVPRGAYRYLGLAGGGCRCWGFRLCVNCCAKPYCYIDGGGAYKRGGQPCNDGLPESPLSALRHSGRWWTNRYETIKNDMPRINRCSLAFSCCRGQRLGADGDSRPATGGSGMSIYGAESPQACRRGTT